MAILFEEGGAAGEHDGDRVRLFVLIEVFGRISRTRLNPIVTVAFGRRRASDFLDFEL